MVVNNNIGFQKKKRVDCRNVLVKKYDFLNQKKKSKNYVLENYPKYFTCIHKS